MRITAACEQPFFPVDQPCDVGVVLTLDCDLTPADRIEFQFPNSWLLDLGPSYTRAVQCTEPVGAHFFSVCAPDVPSLSFALDIAKCHLNWSEGHVRHGRRVTAALQGGVVPAGSPIRIQYSNTHAPFVAEAETLWVRVNGEAPVEAPILTVRGGEHACFRVLAPSGVAAGAPFDVLIVSLDALENPSTTLFRGETLCLADGAVVAEGLDLDGVLRVPVSLEKEGVFRFRLRDTLSNAVRVGGDGPYWGDIHIHTRLSHDAQGNAPFAYARDVSGLDFACVADHWESLGPEGYRIAEEWTEAANTPGTFVTIPGDERNCPELGGHHNVYFRDRESFRAHRALPHGDGEARANSFERLRGADPARVMVVPHHTGIGFGSYPRCGHWNAVQWDRTEDGGLRPALEIYSHHGQSERYDPGHLLAFEWNRMRNRERRANTSVPGPYYAQNYWQEGLRLGVFASSDEHSGRGGMRHGGIAAVFAEALTREAIFDSVRARRSYATTGERILIDFRVDDLTLGMAGRRQSGDEVAVSLQVWGTETLLRVEILRYRFGLDEAFQPLLSEAPRPEGLDAEYALTDTIEGSCLYYARVVQDPLDWPGMAWTTPIWIDIED